MNWISAHLFYYAHANPLLSECVAPLTEDLEEQGLISNYFFIRYWENGSHVRLRLMPAGDAAEPTIKAIVEEHCARFFKRRPALYQLDPEQSGPQYRMMFVMEYGEEAYIEKYGEGYMPFHPSNSVRYIDYEPETVRYGGPAGLELAEWHFGVSSQLVLKMITARNLHVRSVLMGSAFQAMLGLAYGVWKTDERVRTFFEKYVDMWNGFHSRSLGSAVMQPDQLLLRYDKRYKGLQDKLEPRVRRMQALMRREAIPAPLEERWLNHGNEILSRISTLFEQGKLEIPVRSEVTDAGSTELDNALFFLMQSYVHMTNNRLGPSIPDEIYLAHLARRAIEALSEGSHAEHAA